jgi:hypothetical protein
MVRTVELDSANFESGLPERDGLLECVRIQCAIERSEAGGKQQAVRITGS